MPVLPSHPVGLIPAYAGSTSSPALIFVTFTAHPRLRGEHLLCGGCEGVREGSSPLTRGAQNAAASTANVARLIPAYAGSTGQYAEGISRLPAHPRLRGEHHKSAPITASPAGSSPLTRGARRVLSCSFGVLGLIPAYAGSTRASCAGRRTRTAHPRLRGEHVDFRGFELGAWGSSPLTRGALVSPRPTVTAPGLIPAYAGSTLTSHCVE